MFDYSMMTRNISLLVKMKSHAWWLPWRATSLHFPVTLRGSPEACWNGIGVQILVSGLVKVLVVLSRKSRIVSLKMNHTGRVIWNFFPTTILRFLMCSSPIPACTSVITFRPETLPNCQRLDCGYLVGNTLSANISLWHYLRWCCEACCFIPVGCKSIRYDRSR